ncbi:Lrp/AsnC family transcriptional regulator [Klebsiella pneumoniae]|uniref:Lrp/AsnC family transcriptional regulator n=1 Tax=Klebsiella pneumoniae TaxID=573 RepID=UPI0013D62F1A|nr:Lrp/AsnC family transcriptional regulator [Klebsiella pneumoniae]
MRPVLDSFDLQLLALVQQNARLPQAELGERVNLSTAAVNRRLKRLADDGVIKRYAAEVEPAAVGYPLTIIAGVETESERVDLLDEMKHAFASCPEVQQCYYVTGDWDFILIFTVNNMEHYNALTRELFFTNNNVKRFKTFVTMSRVKVGLSLPISIEEQR